MSRQITMVMIRVPDNFLDKAMHAFDLFEPSKKLAVVDRVHLTVTPQFDPARTIQAAVKSAKETGVEIIAVFFPCTQFGWRDETVKTVSNGEGWCLLDDLLKNYGYWEPTSQPGMVGEVI